MPIFYVQGDWKVTDSFVLLLYETLFFIKITKAADESSGYTIVGDLFWLIYWDYTMDGKLTIECAETVSKHEDWKPVAQGPDMTPCDFCSGVVGLWGSKPKHSLIELKFSCWLSINHADLWGTYVLKV